jgi:hypothetical protein
MHEFIDVDEDRPAQPNSTPHMSPSNLAPLRRYPQPPSGSSMQGQATSLPSPPDVPHYGDAPHPCAPPNREPSGCGQHVPYGRAGSVSAPDRSPGLRNHPQFRATNGRLSEGVRALLGPQYYGSRSNGRPTEHPSNETQTSDLGYVPGFDVIPDHHQPMAPPATYSHPPPAIPCPVSAHPSGNYGQQQVDAYSSPGTRRKLPRAAQACDPCRHRKAKCDEGRPECHHCRINNLKCFYKDVPPSKQDKQTAAMTEKLDVLDDNINKLLQMSEKHGRQINMLQTYLPSELKARFQGVPKNTSKSTSHVPLMTEKQARGLQTTPEQAPPSQDQYHDGLADLHATAGFRHPVKHTTAVQHLLSWPTIRPLFPKGKDTELTGAYAMDLETRRGLRLYGCGEGQDVTDSDTDDAGPARRSVSDKRINDAPSSSSSKGVWGKGELPARSSGTNSSSGGHPGYLASNDGLILEADLVESSVNAYMANIHIMHPFLDNRVLRKMVSRFKQRYVWAYSQLSQRQPNAGKRKRTANKFPGTTSDGAVPNRPCVSGLGGVPGIEHSIANAIVLLVIALGRVCAHKDSLPGPTPATSTSTSNRSPHSRPPPSISAPNSPTVHRGMKLEQSGVNTFDPTYTGGKNTDVIPGLAYYAVAAEILGELCGVNLSYIQANLLAGLYMGQLARNFPSYIFISNACRSCQVLIDSTDYKAGRIKPARRNLINFAFWTCLQLEGDILAELQLPQSGITRYEIKMQCEMPNAMTLEPSTDDATPAASAPETILRYYFSQVQLRRTLNDIHYNLYEDKHKCNGADQEEIEEPPPFGIMRTLDDNLENWRNLLNDWNWDDNDHMSSDINVARMRAKYYGAKYIIHRPALQYALTFCSGMGGFPTPRSHRSESPAAGPSYQPQLVSHGEAVGLSARRQTRTGPPTPAIERLDPRARKGAEACIWAAIRSTTAFDRVPERIIITNIFCTAHA